MDARLQVLHRTTAVALFLLIAAPSVVYGQAGIAFPTIFPRPQSATYSGETFTIEESVPVLVPKVATPHDLFVARALVAELSDRYGKALKIRQTDRLPRGEKYILLGDARNPLVRQVGQESGYSNGGGKPQHEGYRLMVTPKHVVVAGADSAGTFYGLQSVRQLITTHKGGLALPGVSVVDAPSLSIRGIRLYIPGPDHIPFFKRFIRDFAALYKFNTVILEMNAVMRLDRHPELNAGALEFARDMNYTRRNRPDGPNGYITDSAHHDAGDGQILEKEEVADLVAYLRRYHFEVIPEIPSLTHSYYLLNRHRELAEIPASEWPDTYCPLNPASYDLVFDVFDEYIEVIKPRIVHIGHDEWRMPVDVCERCKGKDYRELFIQDVNKLYGYLRKKGVRVAMWGDHLLENVRGVGTKDRKLENGYTYRIPGGLTREQVRVHVPKDIMIFNWFWSDRQNDRDLEALGFQQVYGNLTPQITDFADRSSTKGLLGGSASSWAATTPSNFGKDLLTEFLGIAGLLWSADSLEETALQRRAQADMAGIRRSFRGYSYPREDGEPTSTVDISPAANMGAGDVPFTLPDSRGVEVMTNPEGEAGAPPAAIPVGKDVSSLVFMHASAMHGANDYAYRMIYNFDDTAELLGWYEVVYEDGYRMSIPIRYGVNIAAWDSSRTTYLADPVHAGNSAGVPVTFYAYEWQNPRYGKAIASVLLRGVIDFRDWQGRRTPPNRIVLIGITAVDRHKE